MRERERERERERKEERKKEPHPTNYSTSETYTKLYTKAYFYNRDQYDETFFVQIDTFADHVQVLLMHDLMNSMILHQSNELGCVFVYC